MVWGTREELCLIKGLCCWIISGRFPVTKRQKHGNILREKRKNWNFRKVYVVLIGTSGASETFLNVLVLIDVVNKTPLDTLEPLILRFFKLKTKEKVLRSFFNQFIYEGYVTRFSVLNLHYFIESVSPLLIRINPPIRKDLFKVYSPIDKVEVEFLTHLKNFRQLYLHPKKGSGMS